MIDLSIVIGTVEYAPSLNKWTIHRLVYKIADKPGWNIQSVYKLNPVYVFQMSTDGQPRLRHQRLWTPCERERKGKKSISTSKHKKMYLLNA